MRRLLPLLLLFFLATVIAATTSPGLATSRSSAPAIFRVYYDDPANIPRLAAYDLLETRNAAEGYVLVGGDESTQARLEAAGWRVVVDWVQTQHYRPTTGRPIWGGYRTVDELYALLDGYVAAYPTLAAIVDYGDSQCKVDGGCTTPGGEFSPGYDLKALHITNQAVSETKPPFVMLANIHAREFTTPELAIRFSEWLLDNYGSDSEATWFVDHLDIWIIPTANPDGHWIAELATYPPYERIPFMQRKNGRLNGCDTWIPLWDNHYGIDLNRNHTWGWGGPGSGTALCDPGYRGTAPASESEVATLEALLLSILPDQRGPGASDAAPPDTTGIFLTLHSPGGWVLWPWSHQSTPAPNATGLQAVATKLASYNGYTACQSGSCIYLASGTSDDFVYGETGVPSFVYEVGDAFVPPYEEIDDIQWPANAPSFRHAARLARAPYLLAPGPDVLTPTVTPGGPLGPGARYFDISATVDDSTTGNANLATAVYQVDTPYWQTGAISHTLTAVDGAFDSPVEAVVATLDACSPLLTNGRHTVWLRGQDSAGNWGPPWAAFFDVADPGCVPTAVTFVALPFVSSPSPAPPMVLPTIALALLTFSQICNQLVTYFPRSMARRQDH